MGISIKVEKIKDGESLGIVFEQEFSTDQITIGRRTTNDIVLGEPDVSGAHALVSVQSENGGPANVMVTDLRSSNGTYIEDQRIEQEVATAVPAGERIVIGSFLIYAEAVAPSAAAQPAEPPAPEPVITEQAPAAVEVETAPESDRPPDAPSASREQAITLEAAGEPSSKLPAEVSPEMEAEIRAEMAAVLFGELELAGKSLAELSREEPKARELAEALLSDLEPARAKQIDSDRVIKAVLKEALGLGPLEDFLRDEKCREVTIRGPKDIEMTAEGGSRSSKAEFSSNAALEAALRRLELQSGQSSQQGSPFIDVKLPNGIEVHAVLRPLAASGACGVISVTKREPVSLAALFEQNVLSPSMAELLRLAIDARSTILVSGLVERHKVRILNGLVGSIPEHERIATLEDVELLALPQKNALSFLVDSQSDPQLRSAIVENLISTIGAMQIDRLVVSGALASGHDLLQALNSNCRGLLASTVGASPLDAVRRFENSLWASGSPWPIAAARKQFAQSVELIVQVEGDRAGNAVVTAVSEVTGICDKTGEVEIRDVFTFDSTDGSSGKHRATGHQPAFVERLAARGVSVNKTIFSS